MNANTNTQIIATFFLNNTKNELAPQRKYLSENIEIKYGNKGYSLDEMQDIFRGKKCTTKNY